MTARTSGTAAGRLRHRVTLQTPVVRQLENGEPEIEAWRDVAIVMASIEPFSGREWFVAEQFRPGVTTRIRIRWRNDVNASMRVMHGSTVYGIDAVMPNFYGMSELVLMCSDGIVTEGGQP